MPTAEDRRLRSLRPAKPTVDPWRLLDIVVEPERLADGRAALSTTLFLAGRECPFTCVFCDLWRHTTDAPTPAGAIPGQIREGLERLSNMSLDAVPSPFREPDLRLLKLYNASNFFDSGSVPPADDGEIAHLVRSHDKIVVECHPRLVGRRCLSFAERLDGRLEVAMGFETAHPEAFARLNKGAEPDDLIRAAGTLRQAGVDLRAFLLLDPPFVPAAEADLWLRRSVLTALDAGASSVWLIPLRTDSRELRRLQQAGHLQPASLDRIEAAFDAARQLAPDHVRLDAWDLHAFSSDPEADTPRLERLRSLQLFPETGVMTGGDRG